MGAQEHELARKPDAIATAPSEFTSYHRRRSNAYHRANPQAQYPLCPCRRASLSQCVPSGCFECWRIPGSLHAEYLRPVAARGQIFRTLRRGRCLHACTWHPHLGPLFATDLGAADVQRIADNQGVDPASARPGLSHLRQTASGGGIPHTLYRQVACFDPAHRGPYVAGLWFRGVYRARP